MWFDNYLPFDTALRMALPIGTCVKHSSCKPTYVRDSHSFTEEMYADTILQSNCSVSCNNTFLAFRTFDVHTIRYIVEMVELHLTALCNQYDKTTAELSKSSCKLNGDLCIHLEFTSEGYIIGLRDSNCDTCFYTYISNSLPCSDTLSSIPSILKSAIEDVDQSRK